MQVSTIFHPPSTPLELFKAFLDTGAAIAFILVLVSIYYAKNRYPVIERKRTFYSLMLFAILGLVSTIMDAIDEWIWFSPKAFYDLIWKPTRLFLLLGGIFVLIFAFHQFYDFSHRLFGEDTNE
ncbi:MAG: hypothetical protein ACTSYL_03560 [Candidatus Thorarchaeota archaeon]